MSFLGPCLVLAGIVHPLRGQCVIGRWHTKCSPKDCISKGFCNPPEIPILDSEGHVSRHHARVRLDSNSECWIKDLHSLNGTYIIHTTKSAHFERLIPDTWYPLPDGAMVALAYRQSKGPYVVVSYHRNSPQ